jgi:hypothetical protein
VRVRRKALTVDERDAITHPGEGHAVSSEVSERVRSVIAAAEAAASAIRYEAEQDAQTRRRAVEEEANKYLEDARRDADEFLNQRLQRIRELSDSLIERGEQILARLDRADDVRRQFQGLVEALGESAAELAAEASTRHVPQPAPPARAQAAAEPAPAGPVELYPRADQSSEPVAPAETAQPAEPAQQEPSEQPAAVAEGPVAPEPAEVPEAELAEPLRRDRDEDDDQLAARLVALQMAVAGANRGDVEAHLRAHFSIDDSSYVLDDVFGRGTEADKRVTWPETSRDTGS